MSLFLFFFCHRHHPDLRSFPTRRSSDLLYAFEVLGNVRWAVGALNQARRHLNGQERSVELAVLGRLAAEIEYELRSEEHTSELQSHSDLVCRLLLEKKKKEGKTKSSR